MLDFPKQCFSQVLYRIFARDRGAHGAPASRRPVGPTLHLALPMSTVYLPAHEFGHVYWFDNFVPTAGGSFANNFCGGIFCPSGNWEGSPVSFPNTGRFVFFGDTLPYSGSHVPGLPGVLHNINSSAHWASALAAFSPVEDFIETFELSVLLGAGLVNLQINSDWIVPVPTGSWLDWKLGCFS
jgi:hypothetical protein